jgi:predicted nucleic acid-binding protein
MGLVLDSSVLIDAEREARPVSEVLGSIEAQHGETEIILSVISVIEMEHGFHRANTPERALKRRDYLDAAFAAIVAEPFTQDMARLAARIDAEAKKKGITIPFADLLIGVTALHFGYAVGTRNERHFKLIPDLKVLSL